jgi:hypothetical protein
METREQIQSIIKKLEDATPAVEDLGMGRKQWHGDYNLILMGRDVCWLVNHLRNLIYINNNE